MTSRVIILVAILAAASVPAAGFDDCNNNGVPDHFDIATMFSMDCNENGIPDECDIDDETSQDCDGNDVPDECDVAGGEPDCNQNVIPDACEIAGGTVTDCDDNGVPDECDLAAGGPDCDANGALDACDTRLWYVEHPIEGAAWIFSMDDVDGDGDLDALAFEADQSPWKVVWFRNLDGAGAFGPAQIPFVPGEFSPNYSVRFADLDHDGDPDILRESGYSGDDPFNQGAFNLSWFENVDGQGQFGAETMLFQQHGTNHGGSTLWDFVPVDLDGDADEDLVLCYVNTGSASDIVRVRLLVNHPPGQFTDVGTIYSNSLGGETYGFARCVVTDFSGDGAPDIFVYYDQQGSVVWMVNDGTGGFSAAIPIDDYVQQSGSFRWDGIDLDGDLDPDLLRTKDELQAYINVDGYGGFGELSFLVGLAYGGGRPMDLDRDGDADVTVDGEARYWHENTGSGFAEAVRISESGRGLSSLAEYVDIDGDGRLDLPVYSAWLRNESGDCDRNGVPDACEVDCNDNDLADACDIRDGTSIDCNGNAVPDECDAGCTTCDADGDLCVDLLDPSPADPASCGDVDADGCDDCSSGIFDPRNDGPNADVDGICDAGDCAPMDNRSWFEPGPASGLRAAKSGTTVSWTWHSPAEPGGFVHYDTLRSTSSTDFGSAATTDCVESDQLDTETLEDQEPEPGSVLYYLIRVENGCPGDGTMGSGSDSVPRSGLACS